ncbi:MAG: MotA/TolQ/ExbB proton channel family protein [Holosporales bacterium]|jgi:biopolymer transport protein TolQ|nr:MotA/TolQ/ExbB proton channel family protein [Holosporales bacterium]
MEKQQIQNAISDMSDIIVDNTTISTQQISNHANGSVFDMFWNSGFIVKIVMLTLVAASIWSLTIIFSKYIKIKNLKLAANSFENKFWSGVGLETLYYEIKDSSFDPLSSIFCAAMSEWERLFSKSKGVFSSEQKISKIIQIKQIMQITINKEIEDIEKNMTFLSTLGTNGVIIGILGMVVSIMDGMKTIGITQAVGMAAVAPIISESLFTTALGIFVTIPAAVMYNKLSSDINKYTSRLETFSEEFSSIMTRQIDEY